MPGIDQKWFCQLCGFENTGRFCCECGAEKPENVDTSKPPENPVNNGSPSDYDVSHFFSASPFKPAFGMMSEPFFMTLYKTREENRSLVKSRYNCGCYTCCKVFDPKEITQWVDEKYAVCPYCNSATVVGDASFDSVDAQLLDKINRCFIKKEVFSDYTPPQFTCDDSPWICPTCNSQVKGGLYCFTCGTKNPKAINVDAADADKQESWVCPNCNSEVKGSVYCHECGNKKPDL